MIIRLTGRKIHHHKDTIELITMVGSAGLDIFLFTMKDRFIRQEFSEDTTEDTK